MSDLEDLERRKKELELRRDIAKLERNERIVNQVSNIAADAKELSVGISTKVAERGVKTGGWSWLWVGPLTLFGLYLVLVGLVDGSILVSLFGAVCLVPLWAKLTRKS
ncbi:MAG: hypothetical protein IPG93_11270 [Burkholderiales bacterium]|nr:hypothetical protein [Burkholderiales bacterium]